MSEKRNLSDELWIAIEQNRPANPENVLSELKHLVDEFNISVQSAKTKDEIYKIAQNIVLKINFFI